MNKAILKNKYILGVVAVLVVLLIVGYKSEAKLNIDTKVQTSCNEKIKDKTFCKFAGVFANVDSYVADMTLTQSGEVTTATVAIASNGDANMTVTSAGVKTMITKYQGITYALDSSDNQWIQYAANSAEKPTITDIKTSLETADFKNSKGQTEVYANRGSESVNGTECYKYQNMTPDTEGEVSYLWFSKKDYKPVKLESTIGNDVSKMTFSYGTVTVTKPSPVKQVVN